MYIVRTCTKANDSWLVGWERGCLPFACILLASKSANTRCAHLEWLPPTLVTSFCRFKMIWVTPKDKFFRRWRDQDPKVADFDQSITQYIELSNKVSLLTEGSSANSTLMLSFVILSHLIPVIDTASLLAKCCVCSVPYSDFSSPSLSAPLLFIICM